MQLLQGEFWLKTGVEPVRGTVWPSAVVSLQSAKTEFELNLNALKAAGDLDRHTLDLLA